GLWSLPMPMPGVLLSYTLAVVHLGPGGAVTLVDPGWGLPDSHERLGGFLRSRGRRLSDVAKVVVTHAHRDHLGFADELGAVSGATTVLSRREMRALTVGAATKIDQFDRMRAWGAPPDVARHIADLRRARRIGVRPPSGAVLLVEDGDVLPIDGVTWRVVLTPGHTAGHMCLEDADRRVLFSGDHVLPTVRPGIGLGGRLESNPVADYLSSLERIESFEDFEIVPGHGYRFRGLRWRRQDAVEHTRRRAREVSAVVASDPDASVWDVASRLTWTAGWEQLVSTHLLFSGLAQTEMYREFVAEHRS
ncbi:MAG: MBL fold metallo-hydrolase, partial [Microbacterium sp.]